jgi:energy-coupling factor transporter ATP-binding protein EcfA2
MECEVLVLDEPTSMVDLRDRREILDLFQRLHEDQGIALLHITHSFEEALQAEELIYLEDGRVSFYGPPEEFLTSTPSAGASNLQIPPLYQLILGLREQGHPIPPGVHSYAELKSFLLERGKAPCP